ncbi:unnamed protein product [Hapterophycus canaliculatus]
MTTREDALALGAEQSHRIIAVLEEAAEKLGFLGSIMPDVLQHRDELSKFVGDEISRIIQEQRQLEARYEKLIAQRSTLKGLANKSRYKEIQAEIQEVSLALRESTKNLCRNLKDNPNISGNLLKIQRERTELIDLLSTTCRQIGEARSFPGLVSLVEDSRLAQSQQSELVRREKEATQAVKKLEADLFAERADHSRQVTENKTTMIDLKQTLLKVKSKTTVDVKYSRKEHSARVSSLLRVYEQYERQLEGQVKEVERLREVEAAVNTQTMEFLEKKRKQLQDEVDAWEERQAKTAAEVGELEKTCDDLTNERNAMLVRLEGLKRRKQVEKEEEQAREDAKTLAVLEEQARTELERRQNQAAGQIQRVLKQYVMRQIASKGKKGKKGAAKGKGGKKGKK